MLRYKFLFLLFEILKTSCFVASLGPEPSRWDYGGLRYPSASAFLAADRLAALRASHDLA